MFKHSSRPSVDTLWSVLPVLPAPLKSPCWVSRNHEALPSLLILKIDFLLISTDEVIEALEGGAKPEAFMENEM